MKQYLKNFFAWLGFGWKVLLGKPFPRPVGQSGDRRYMTVTEGMFKECALEAAERMIQDGVTYEKLYLDDAFDCVNFACAACTYFEVALTKSYGIGAFGIPTGVVVYRDDRRGGHSVWFCDIEDTRRYFGGYPIADLSKGFKEKIMSLSELGSINTISMR